MSTNLVLVLIAISIQYYLVKKDVKKLNNDIEYLISLELKKGKKEEIEEDYYQIN